MFLISHQTVMSATCQPSLEPAVPLASVAPATCPYSQRDLVDASGRHTHMHMHTHTHSETNCTFCIILLLFAFRLSHMH